MFGILTILVIVLSIIITAQNITKEKKNKPETIASNPSPTQTPNPTSASTPSQAPNDTPTLIPSTPTPTPTPTTIAKNENQTILDFKYPNSTTISQNEKDATFESTDNPKTITDWYKDKIKSMGMNTTSFVQTNTNGNILNKLVGGKSGSEVRVEISKQNNQLTVKISVTL